MIALLTSCGIWAVVSSCRLMSWLLVKVPSSWPLLK